MLHCMYVSYLSWSLTVKYQSITLKYVDDNWFLRTMHNVPVTSLSIYIAMKFLRYC